MEGIADFDSSSNVEMREVEGRGRCLFLTTPMKKGDIIFEEDPFVSCQHAWNKTYQYLACDFCMQPLESVEENISRLSGNKCFELSFLEYDPTSKDDVRQCESCNDQYCSQICRQNAWTQYHQFLCFKNNETEPLARLVDRWKQIHGPPETFNIEILARIIAIIQMAVNKEAVYNTFMQFCHLAVNEDQSLCHILLQEKFKCDIDELWPMFCGIMQTKCNEFNKNIFTDMLLTREGFIRLLSLMGRNGQGIGTSILAQWSKTILDLDVPPDVKEKIESLVDTVYDSVEEYSGGEYLNNEGTALYVMQSCINHSCSPNAKVTFPFNTNRLAVKAKRDMLPGDEILISYIDKCSRNRSVHSRRKILRDHYLFTCLCSKCVTDSHNEPDVTSEEEEDSCEDVDM